MVREDGLLPLSRGQLDIWLSHESGLAGTKWQLGLLGRIDGTVQPGLLLEAIRQGMREAEPARAAFFEIDGQVFQKPIDYSDIELPFHDFRNFDDPVRKVREAASSIQRTPMSLSGQLAKFALFRTRVDEYYWFGLCHHISVDGLSMALVCRRIATIYSAMVSGGPVPPAYFGSLQDAVDCEADYQASSDFRDDQAYWSNNLPPESALDYQLPQAALACGGRPGRWPD
jgi:glycopeptidolipid biosynthesis protein